MTCHSRKREARKREPSGKNAEAYWVPAFAGMTSMSD